HAGDGKGASPRQRLRRLDYSGSTHWPSGVNAPSPTHSIPCATVRPVFSVSTASPTVPIQPSIGKRRGEVELIDGVHRFTRYRVDPVQRGVDKTESAINVGALNGQIVRLVIVGDGGLQQSRDEVAFTRMLQ